MHQLHHKLKLKRHRTIGPRSQRRNARERLPKRDVQPHCTPVSGFAEITRMPQEAENWT